MELRADEREASARARAQTAFLAAVAAGDAAAARELLRGGLEAAEERGLPEMLKQCQNIFGTLQMGRVPFKMLAMKLHGVH